MTTTNTDSWMARAACRNADPEIFFPIGVVPSARQLRAALRICGRCEVRAECLNYALRTGQTAGVWGGTTEQQRRALREEALHETRA